MKESRELKLTWPGWLLARRRTSSPLYVIWDMQPRKEGRFPRKISLNPPKPPSQMPKCMFSSWNRPGRFVLRKENIWLVNHQMVTKNSAISYDFPWHIKAVVTHHVGILLYYAHRKKNYYSKKILSSLFICHFFIFCPATRYCTTINQCWTILTEHEVQKRHLSRIYFHQSAQCTVPEWSSWSVLCPFMKLTLAEI